MNQWIKWFSIFQNFAWEGWRWKQHNRFRVPKNFLSQLPWSANSDWKQTFTSCCHFSYWYIIRWINAFIYLFSSIVYYMWGKGRPILAGISSNIDWNSEQQWNNCLPVWLDSGSNSSPRGWTDAAPHLEIYSVKRKNPWISIFLWINGLFYSAVFISQPIHAYKV